VTVTRPGQRGFSERSGRRGPQENHMLKILSAFCAVSALGFWLVPSDARATPATEAFIQQNFDKGYLILNSTSLSEAQRREQFRSLLLDLAASRRIALFTLGPYA